MDIENKLIKRILFLLLFCFITIGVNVLFSILNSDTNQYKSQWDSNEDQRSIIKGAYFAHKNGFRNKK